MNKFKTVLKSEAARFMKKTKDIEYFEVYSHADADGLTSASLIIKYLINQKKQFRLRIINELSGERIKEINNPAILCDLGSAQLSRLKEVINNKLIIILDHHQLDEAFTNDNLIHVNPCINESMDLNVSSSVVTYLMLKECGYTDSRLAGLALIGALGDEQEITHGLNSELLSEAEISRASRLNTNGHNLKPLVKILEYSRDYEIPGVTGSEDKARLMLEELNIPLSDDKGGQRTLSDLSSKENERLLKAIIEKRAGLVNPEGIMKESFEFKLMGLTKTLDEWGSIINSCAKTKKFNAGIKLLLEQDESEALEAIKVYSRELNKASTWVIENKDKVSLTEKVAYIKAYDSIPINLIGVICSIAMQSKIFNKDLIIGISDKGDDELKISARSSKSEFNVGLMLKEASKNIGMGGGHRDFGGAVIKKNSEEAFINNFERLLKG